MYFLSTGRNQRPRGLNVKPDFQFTLTLGVCIWLICQIKHSNNRKDVGSLQAKFGERNSVVILGRKGDVGLSDKGMHMSDANHVILEVEAKQEDRGGGDDKFGNVDDEGGNETLYKAIEHIHEDVKTNAEDGKKMEPAIPYNLSSNSEKIEIEMRDVDNEVFSENNSQGVETSKRFVSNLEEKGMRRTGKSKLVLMKENMKVALILSSKEMKTTWKDTPKNYKKMRKWVSMHLSKAEMEKSKENGEDKA